MNKYEDLFHAFCFAFVAGAIGALLVILYV
jgi:hypothetical protein